MRLSALSAAAPGETPSAAYSWQLALALASPRVIQIALSTIPAAVVRDEPLRIVAAISRDAIRGTFTAQDPNSMQLYLLRPDGSQQQALRYPGGGLNRDSLGIISADFVPDTAGTYKAVARAVIGAESQSAEIAVVVAVPRSLTA